MRVDTVVPGKQNVTLCQMNRTHSLLPAGRYTSVLYNNTVMIGNYIMLNDQTKEIYASVKKNLL